VKNTAKAFWIRSALTTPKDPKRPPKRSQPNRICRLKRDGLFTSEAFGSFKFPTLTAVRQWSQEVRSCGSCRIPEQGLIRKTQDKHLHGKIAKLLDSLAPELMQLLIPEFPILLGRPSFREVPEFRSRRMNPALLVCEGSPSTPQMNRLSSWN
jgi:hypothetical protein